VKQYYGYNHSKAVAALRILTNSELEQIKKLLDKGGNR
jgi:16S rRNA C1402 N4-methylase RsmH